MPEESPTCPIRGAVRVIITTSTDSLVAGDPFTIFITIQNPFERELIVHGVSTSFPTEFEDLGPRHQHEKPGTPENQHIESNSSVVVPNVTQRTNILDRIVPVAQVQPKTSFARGITELEKNVVIPLQPGNSTIRAFTIKTRKNIWFKPSTYRFNIEIDYELAGCRNSDTIEHIVNIRASLISIMVGAAIGGLGGWLVNKKDLLFFDGTSLFANLISLIVSIIIALLAVVLLARKKDIQPLITVEDLWGGIAIGFIAAYSGPRYLISMIQPGGQPVGTNATA